MSGGGFDEKKPGGSSLVQRMLERGGNKSTIGVAGKRTLTEQLAMPQSATHPVVAGVAPVQRSMSAHEAGRIDTSDDGAVRQAAAKGVAGGGGRLPHGDTIQRLFGRHDISGIEAHVGGTAEIASRSIGAEAYATGHHLAFTGPPNLHTAAHEAAHVVQQRGDIQLKGGVGEAGDTHEQHADAVADAVVQGKSAEGLLDRYSGSHLPAVPPRTGVQRKPPTHTVSAADLSTRGDEQHAADLSEKQVRDAIVWNDKHWTGKQRQDLRTFLTHTAASEGSFTEADVRAAWKIQIGAGVEPAHADGMIGDTTMAILLHAGLTLGAEGKAKAQDVQLLFMPGEFEDVAQWQAAVTEAIRQRPTEPYRAILEGRVPMPAGTGRVYVKVKGNIIDVVDARGGPPVTVKDFGGHTADPTTAGTWRLGGGESVVTTDWDNSQIPWGAEVRKRADGEWEFKDPDTRKWKIATGRNHQLKKPLVVEVFEGARFNRGRSTWRVNDFGEMGWRIHGTDGQLIHTTPEDEETNLAGSSPELSASHGCVHLDPGGRSRLRNLGYLQEGVTFVVRKYTVHLLPEAMRRIMQGDQPLHEKPTP